jgi:hypothetical protein
MRANRSAAREESMSMHNVVRIALASSVGLWAAAAQAEETVV